MLGAALGVSAQRHHSVPFVGYMSPGDVPRYDNAFLQGLEEQGFILPGEISRYDEPSWKALVKRGGFEGQKIRLAIRATADDFPKHAPALADELVRLGVVLMFASTAPEADAARGAIRRANRNIPLVFGPQLDPVGGGLVASLSRPGGNITGLLSADPELSGKRLELLVETLPKLSRVSYLYGPSAMPPGIAARAKEAVIRAARVKGIRLNILEIQHPTDIEPALAAITSEGAEALIVTSNPVLLHARHRIVKFSEQHRLPAMHSDAIFVEAGGLMFYGTPYVDLNRRAAAVVAKVLTGTSPSDIPVEQPTQFKLLINLRTAKTLGIVIPQSVQIRAEMFDSEHR